MGLCAAIAVAMSSAFLGFGWVTWWTVFGYSMATITVGTSFVRAARWGNALLFSSGTLLAVANFIPIASSDGYRSGIGSAEGVLCVLLGAISVGFCLFDFDRRVLILGIVLGGLALLSSWPTAMYENVHWWPNLIGFAAVTLAVVLGASDPFPLGRER